MASPILDAAAVTTSTVNREALMELFVRRSRVNAPLSTASRDWYFVMDAGFDYVDEICDSYIHEMFLLDRGRDKVKSGIILLDKATNAILEATRASTKSMVVVAQAFGIAAGATDVFANSCLFELEPANIQQLVREMQKRTPSRSLCSAQQFSYPTAVEHRIQAYLNLCLPATIEARVNEILQPNQGHRRFQRRRSVHSFKSCRCLSVRRTAKRLRRIGEIMSSDIGRARRTHVRTQFGREASLSITGPRNSGSNSQNSTRDVQDLQNRVRQKDETIPEFQGPDKDDG